MEFSVPIAGKTAGKLQVIITNLHWRYSGVTATNRMVAPKLDAMIEAAWLGTDAPDGTGEDPAAVPASIGDAA